jgi:hypothetical protein
VPSNGRVHRRPAKTHGRIVHLLSDLELSAFLCFDWSETVIDIREQFPLNPEKTIGIAERNGIQHPSVKGVNQIMTTDLLLDVQMGDRVVNQAVSIKYRNDLDDTRVLEKQEIEKRFWESENVDWFPFTENEVPVTLIQNIKWIMPHLSNFELDENTRHLTFEMIGRMMQLHPGEKIPVVMHFLDEQYKAEKGTYLQYLRHLLAQGAFYWNMAGINHRSLRVEHLTPSIHWLNRDYEYVYAE